MAPIAKTPAAVIWKRRLARWRQSGLSVAVFCHREGVSAPSLYAWRRRLASLDAPAAVTPSAVPGAVQESPFVPVKLKSAPISIELLLPEGHILRLPEDFDIGRLVELLKAVGAC
jgi:transposase